MDKYQPILSLRLLNGEQLESGNTANARFTTEGGTIGSSQQCQWPLQDQMGSISGMQCQILWNDQSFCLQTINEPVYVNHAAISMYAGPVRLSAGDQIQIGQLKLKAHINLTGQEGEDTMLTSPQALVSADANPLDTLLEEKITLAPHYDDSFTLAPTINGELTPDPLKALDCESLTTLEDAKKSEEAFSVLQQNHYQHSRFNSPLSDNQRNTMVQEFMDLPEINTHEDDLPFDVEHVAINPLMQGLGAHLNLQNSQQANDFLVEIGKTLRAAIEGLLALQQQQESLQDKQLRPIEDNPLRLNCSYQETLNLMFTDQRSPVHLSPPSAISESLHNMQLHYQANQAAISTALDTMLNAFSPAHLLKRFSHYRRASDNREADAAWAWEMYTNYFDELSSSRQQGFEKLFYEVYTHAYDRALRKGLEGA